MKVLWLASWYPSKVDAFNGDFIQRQAIAVAGFCQVYVIHVVKDQTISPKSQVTEIISGNLTEKIIYYRSSLTGIAVLDRIISHRRYMKLFTKAVNKYKIEAGKPDFVHVHVAMKAGLVALWIKKRWGMPFVVTEHWAGYYRQCVPSVYDFNWFFRIEE